MQNMLDFYLNSIKEKYRDFSTLKDYELFSLLCIKYFYFAETNIPFDPEIILENLTDGSNDGGIDAIINDQNSDGNDMIIIQSKYYNKVPLKVDDIISGACKIEDTLSKLKNNRVSEFNDRLVNAYREANGNMEDSGEIKIVFFTSYQPKNNREKNSIRRKLNKHFKDYDFEIFYKDDIETQIEICENGKLSVDNDSLKIDDKDNYLQYEDSVIVNISAKSLQELQNRRRNGLLGKNLRYYIKKKEVDEGIDDTIKNEPENFWYKNNGILIVCDDFYIDGIILKMENFSIVNGGQTTNRIGNIDIDEDFYLQCKVVKTKGNNEQEKDKFVYNIAESTNSQKPIKQADLKANAPEQLKLKERFSRYHVYYMTKKGDKVPKQYLEQYQRASLEQVGKLGLAGIIQMPGSARSNSRKMYNDDIYHNIFGYNTKEGFLVDLLKISFYYHRFLKSGIKNKGFDEMTTIPMIRNGRTYQFACITLLCKIHNGVVRYEDITFYRNDTDTLKNILCKTGNMERIILNKLDNEEQIFYQMFEIIGDEVLGYCYQNALDKAAETQITLAPSNYLKSDTNYYNDIIPRLWRIYNSNSSLNQAIKTISTKNYKNF